MRFGVARSVLSVAIAISVAEFAPLVTSAQEHPASTVLAINATGENDLQAWQRYIVQHERSGNLRVRSSAQDPDLPARTIMRLDQFHEGVRIWGGDIAQNAERGVPVSIHGAVAPDLQLSVTPTLTTAQAASRLNEIAGSHLMTDPELVVLPLPTGGFALAYDAVVATDDVARVFIDAHTGRELWRFSELHFQSAVGTGHGIRGDVKKLSVIQQQGVFVATDSHRPPAINTYDMAGNLARTKLILNGAAFVSGDLAHDTDNDWTDGAVVDAHAHIAWTYDFFFKRFGRHGLDDRDRPIVAITNPVTQQGALSLPLSDFGVFAANAFWCDVCGPGRVGLMMFGSGLPSNVVLAANGQTVSNLAAALDVVAHELTHGVTTSSSNLIGANESGALNESFSDMMGTSAEFFYHDLIPNSAPADYLLGEDAFRAGRAGGSDGIRSMSNPALFGHPDHYRNRYVGPSDDGGVHFNVGIPNHAFYLAIEGGTNRTSGINVPGVGAANREQIEKSFFRAFTLLLPSNATFVTARSATTQAARDLYGAGSRAEQMIDLAWSAVGVPDPREISIINSSVPASTQTSFAFSMTATGTYQINLRGNDATLDLDLYLSPNTSACSRWPLPTSCVLSRSITPDAVESVKWPVRTGESYRIWVDNLGARASTFTIEHVVTQ